MNSQLCQLAPLGARLRLVGASQLARRSLACHSRGFASSARRPAPRKVAKSSPAASPSSKRRAAAAVASDPVLDPDEESGDDMVPYNDLLRQFGQQSPEPPQRSRVSAAAAAVAQTGLQLPPEHTQASTLVQRAWTETEGRVARISAIYPELTPEKLQEIDSAVDELFAYTMLPKGFEEGQDRRHLDALSFDDADLDHWWETHPKDSQNMVRFLRILTARGDTERVWKTFQEELWVGGNFDPAVFAKPEHDELLSAGRSLSETTARLEATLDQAEAPSLPVSSSKKTSRAILQTQEPLPDEQLAAVLRSRVASEYDLEEMDTRQEAEAEAEAQLVRYRQQFLDQGSVLTHDVCLSVLTGLASRGARDRTTGLKLSQAQEPELSTRERELRVSRAWEVVRWMKRLGLQRSEAIYGALIHTCGTWGDIQGARQAFEEVRQMLRLQQEPRAPNVVCWTALMNAYLKERKLEDTWRVFHGMRMAGVRPDLPAFDTAMRLTAEEEGAEKAIDLMQELRHNYGLEPSLHTYCNLMLACSNRPDFYLMTFRYFDELIHQGFVPNRYVYNILLRACTKHGDLANALLVMREMHWMRRQQLKDRALSESTLRPDEMTYTSLIQCIAKTMHQPAVKTAGVSDSFIGIKDRLSMVESFLEEMQQAGLSVRIKTVNCVMLAYARCGQWKQAEGRLKDLTEKHGLVPNFFSYLVLMRMYCQLSDVPRALSVLERMKVARIVLDYTPYALLLKMCQRRRLSQLGKQILAEAEQLGFRVPSGHAHKFRPEFEATEFKHSEHPDYDPEHPYNTENIIRAEEMTSGHARSSKRDLHWAEKFPVKPEKNFYRLTGDRLADRPLGLPLDRYSNEVRQIKAAQEHQQLAASAGGPATQASAAAVEEEELALDAVELPQPVKHAAKQASRSRLQDWDKFDEDIGIEDLELDKDEVWVSSETIMELEDQSLETGSRQ